MEMIREKVDTIANNQVLAPYRVFCIQKRLVKVGNLPRLGFKGSVMLEQFIGQHVQRVEGSDLELVIPRSARVPATRTPQQ